MDLRLTEDQRLIAQSAADFLAEAAAMPATRAAADGDEGLDRSLWRGIAELGWCGVHLPEACGGLGLGMVELVLLQEQLGRRLACVPFFDHAVASTLLRDAADETARARWLPRLATGESVATLATAAATARNTLTARARRTGDGWHLHGRWPQVGSAAQADLLLLAATDEAGAPVLLVLPRESAGLQVTPLMTLDRTRRSADVVAEGVQLDVGAVVTQGAALAAALERNNRLAAIALAAEQLGAAQQCLDLSVAYTMQRVQFGRPIAAFQAVKHRCAQMMVAVESARSAVYGAAAVADSDAGAGAATLALHAAQALVEANEAAQCCAQEAIQLHGGVGFTWEYDPHLYFKRAQANGQRLGPVSVWLEAVAARVLDNEADGAAA